MDIIYLQQDSTTGCTSDCTSEEVVGHIWTEASDKASFLGYNITNSSPKMPKLMPKPSRLMTEPEKNRMRKLSHKHASKKYRDKHKQEFEALKAKVKILEKDLSEAQKTTIQLQAENAKLRTSKSIDSV